MGLTEFNFKHWPALAVVVALLVVFGILSALKLPIQLLPNIEEPQISIGNFWRAAAPEEMESVIIEPQEDVLRNLPGLTDINSWINRGSGWVNLTFAAGTDIQEAKLNVINALNQTPPRPPDAQEPRVNAGGGGRTPGAASLLIRVLPGNPNRDLATYQDLIEAEVEPRLARVKGVSAVQLQGEQPRELHITLDTYRAAALGISINDVASVISRSTDVSGGTADVGRRRYTVRFVGKFSPDSLNELIVGWSGERPVYLREVAEVQIVPRDRDGFTLRNGYPSYYITVQREFGSNTVTLLDGVNAAIVDLNNGPLKEAGLAIDLSFDSSVHIRRAISLIRDNLGLGMLLATAVLYFLMRSRRGVALVAATVPLSIMVAFIVLSMTGRSLNVISLAGLAFAVGLVMDAAIIALENIVRLRQEGMEPRDAVEQGCAQIRGALFASTATSVAIFLPVLFISGVEGQMFRDLALTLAVAVTASFVIAITVLPVAARGWLGKIRDDDPCSHWWTNIARFVNTLTRTKVRAAAWTVGLLAASIACIVFLMPKSNFLPQAPADSINAGFILPPGGTVEMLETEIASKIVERLEPYMEHEKEPYIRGYNLSAFGSFNALFLYPEDPQKIETMIEILKKEILIELPDTTAFVQRSTLLNFGYDGGRSINIDLQGSDIETITESASIAMGIVSEAIPAARTRPVPGLAISEPELQLIPNDRRITSAGLDRASVATAIRTVTSGSFVGEYFDGNTRMDMILRGPEWNSPDELAAIPVATPLAGIQSLGELAQINRTVGPSQLLRVNGGRTVTLSVLPPDDMTVEEALDILRDEVGPKLRAALPSDVTINYRGTADRLDAAFSTMAQNLALALLILFLIMAAMFRSLWDSFLVFLAIPLALAGGVLGLRGINLITMQSLDLLTMIGFIILLGLVVNNAILLVLQTRTGQAEGMEPGDAIIDAVKLRARPIYMSTLTSLFGMLPLAFIPGVGSEIYRGLAVVIIGGMFVNALFTLVFIPSLLRLEPAWARGKASPVTDSTSIPKSKPLEV
ncbi:MAG: efflux RND transporter permease subunit [Gammaproteobacteria bacterium]